MFYILGFVVFLIITIFADIIFGGLATVYFTIPAMLLLLLSLVAVMTATRSFKVFGRGLKAVILPKKPLSEETRGQAATLFRLLSKTTALAAAIGVLINVIIMLIGSDWSDLDARLKLGGNIAISLIFPLYALFMIAAIFEPVVFNLKKRRDTVR